VANAHASYINTNTVQPVTAEYGSEHYGMHSSNKPVNNT